MSDKDKLIELLKTHDWSYPYSDDHRYYKAGEAEEKEILALVKKLGEEGKQLYKQYKPLKEAKPLDDKTVEKSDSIMKDLKTNKRDFVKKYGKDAEKVMKGRSINMAKKRVAENRIKDAIKEVLNEIGSDDKVIDSTKMDFIKYKNFINNCGFRLPKDFWVLFEKSTGGSPDPIRELEEWNNLLGEVIKEYLLN